MQLSMFDDSDMNLSMDPPLGTELEKGDLHIGRQLTISELVDLVGEKVLVENESGAIRLALITAIDVDANPVYGCGNNPPDPKYGPIINTYMFNDYGAKDLVPSYYHEIGRETRIHYNIGHKEDYIASELYSFGGRWDSTHAFGDRFYELKTEVD